MKSSGGSARVTHRKPRRHWPLRLLLTIADLYAIALAVYFVLRLLFGDRLWPVALVGVFLPWLLLPALLLFPAMLLLRRWPAAALQGLNVAAFLWLFGGLFLPQFPPPIHGQHLTVMAYNVFNGRAAPQDLVALIRSTDADIVAVTELAEGQAAVLEKDLREQYPYQVLYGDGMPGLGLLSRYPIQEHVRYEPPGYSWPYLRATLQITNATSPFTCTIIVAHLPSPSLDRHGYHIHPAAAGQVAAVVALAQAGQPALVLGDFNMADQSDNYRLLTDAGLTDAFRAAGWGLGATYPVHQLSAPFPLVRIDYVWYTAPFQASRAWVGPDAGSNHLPVLAELRW
jgi:endonuclease/exonuclease/phosphatase (EEP) superfamily protein YafD